LAWDAGVSVRIIQAHVLDGLAQLADESVHCVVTSPPYYGLRSYGIPPQTWSNGWVGDLGLEPNLGQYLDHMVEVCREIRRVLRSDGTFWLNIGSSYANDGKWGGHTGGKHVKALHDTPIGRNKKYTGFKPKDEMLIPARLAICLQQDGWWVRSEITWAKRAPMPESVTDRPTSATEKVFLLTRSPRYYYDAEAVKEPSEYPGDERHLRTDNTIEYARPDNGSRARTAKPTAANRNLRNWWLLGPEPFAAAHFATFPTEIPRRAILAGTSERGCCPKCSAPWGRVVDKRYNNPGNRTTNGPRSLARRHETAGFPVRLESEVETIGWRPTCRCNLDIDADLDCVPATVLDPFLGAGTTALVADRLGRNCIGIELSDSYVAMARRRIESDAGMFAQVAAE
jgi:DNA modification methylase